LVRSGRRPVSNWVGAARLTLQIVTDVQVVAIVREMRGTALWPEAVGAAERLLGSGNLALG
jgi:hypothetical protein